MGGESTSSCSMQQASSQNQDLRKFVSSSWDAPRQGRVLWSEEMDDELRRGELRTPSPNGARSPSPSSAAALDANAPEFAPELSRSFAGTAAPVFVPVTPMPLQSQDPYDVFCGVPWVEGCLEFCPLQFPQRGFGYGLAAAPSAGSLGHPYSCGPACKYASKARIGKGCKDGTDCTHCHLCVWSSTQYSRQRRDRRKAAHRQQRQLPLRREKEWSNDAESTAMGSTDSPLISESEAPSA